MGFESGADDALPITDLCFYPAAGLSPVTADQAMRPLLCISAIGDPERPDHAPIARGSPYSLAAV